MDTTFSDLDALFASNDGEIKNDWAAYYNSVVLRAKGELFTEAENKKMIKIMARLGLSLHELKRDVAEAVQDIADAVAAKGDSPETSQTLAAAAQASIAKADEIIAVRWRLEKELNGLQTEVNRLQLNINTAKRAKERMAARRQAKPRLYGLDLAPSPTVSNESQPMLNGLPQEICRGFERAPYIPPTSKVPDKSEIPRSGATAPGTQVFYAAATSDVDAARLHVEFVNAQAMQKRIDAARDNPLTLAELMGDADDPEESGPPTE